MKQKLTLFLALLILPPFVIFTSRELFSANYLFSSIYKIIFLFPLVYRVWIEKKSIKQGIVEHFSFSTLKKHIVPVVSIGVFLATVYIGSFMLFKGFLDLEGIAIKLQEVMDLNVTNLIFIGLYIILINSLLEEYFWRGFMFDKLRGLVSPWLAYALTGVAFSFHHVVFYYNWFTPLFFWLVTIGLIGYAVIMNYIFSRYKDLFSCWVIHAFADVVQIYIAFTVLRAIS